MATTELLAIGTDAANSADQTVEAGSQMTVAMKGDSGQIVVEIKDDDGNYWPVERLSYGKRTLVIVGAGTYRLSRPEGSNPCGAFRD